MFISVAQAAEQAAGHAAAHGGLLQEGETWVAVTWLIVAALLAKPIFRGLTGALDVRREKIKSRIEEAERLRAEAQATLAAYEKKLRESLKDAEDMVAHAIAEADRLAAQSARDLEDLLKRREQQALERIAQAEAEAVRDVRNTAVDIAIAATRQLIADALPPESASAMVDQAIKELPIRLH